MSWTPIPPPPPDVVAATAETARLAEVGEAPGQCPECQSSRLDGKPPHIHQDGCSMEEPIDVSVRRWIAERREV